MRPVASSQSVSKQVEGGYVHVHLNQDGRTDRNAQRTDDVPEVGASVLEESCRLCVVVTGWGAAGRQYKYK